MRCQTLGERNAMSKDYVEERDAGYWIKGTRVPLEPIVFAFLRDTSLKKSPNHFL
jgi:hypothetical protein